MQRAIGYRPTIFNFRMNILSHICSRTIISGQEQHPVRALLMYNRSFKILWCASYMHHKYPELTSKHFSTYPPNRVPTSLYIQKKG